MRIPRLLPSRVRPCLGGAVPGLRLTSRIDFTYDVRNGLRGEAGRLRPARILLQPLPRPPTSRYLVRGNACHPPRRGRACGAGSSGLRRALHLREARLPSGRAGLLYFHHPQHGHASIRIFLSLAVESARVKPSEGASLSSSRRQRPPLARPRPQTLRGRQGRSGVWVCQSAAGRNPPGALAAQPVGTAFRAGTIFRPGRTPSAFARVRSRDRGAVEEAARLRSGDQRAIIRTEARHRRRAAAASRALPESIRRSRTRDQRPLRTGPGGNGAS